MSRKLCRFSGRWLGVFALLWLVCSAVRADDPPAVEGVKPLSRIQARVLRIQVNDEGQVQVEAEGPVSWALRRVPLSGHWLGLECAPLGAALRSHLKAPEGQGLLVVSIVSDSPAEKKLQPHDVLLSAGGAPLSNVGDLLEAVEKSKDAELEFELIRGGQTITVGVQPVVRPVVLAGPWGRQGRLQVIRPGMILSCDTLKFFSGSTAAAFPRGLSVVIKKTGDGPATITVQQGDQKWEVSEEELDELPEDVRAHVQRLRGNGHLDREGAVRILTAPRMKASPAPALPRLVTPGFPRGEAERVMEEMKQRIERLEREFDRRFGSQEDDSDQDAPEKKRREEPQDQE